MDRLQHFLELARHHYRDASPKTRTALGGCLLLVFVSLSLLLFTSSATEQEPLLGNHELTNAEITQVTQHFVAAGLDQWELKNKQIFIPKDQRVEYLTAIDGKFEPHAFNSDVDSVLQGGSILDTPSLREMRLRNAREKDLARILMQIPGVEEAQINIDDHQERGLSGKKEMTALAAIKANPQSEVTLEMSEAIREVIAARFAGLDRNHVVVIDLNTGHTFGAADSNYNASDLDIALRNYERWWRGRIANLLVDIPNTRLEVGLYPITTSNPNQSINSVKATVSVGIPDSYIQQVAISRQATSPEQRQATAHEVKQNISELVGGVLPVVPHSTIDEFDVHVATIMDIAPDSTNLSGTSLFTVVTQFWRELVMLAIALSFITALIWKQKHTPNQKSASYGMQETAFVPPPAQQLANELEDRVVIRHEPQLAKPPITASTDSQTTFEPTLKDELNALVDEAPADAADILKKWISSTSS